MLLELLARKSPQVPGILLVANKLQKIGGVETRIRALTDALQHAGYQVYILTEINGNQFEINANLLEFSFTASNFEQVLCAAIEKLKIKVVEFQCKNVSFLRQLDLDKLKKICGMRLHNPFLRKITVSGDTAVGLPYFYFGTDESMVPEKNSV